ncbi:MAG: tyrosine-protein kinase [Solirubrobacteraceae bacterium]|nr:tyrosine-protein kinase [Solirubrobacteraceae bacterium]
MDQLTHSATDGVDLRQYLRPIWGRKWWILLVVVAATAASYAYYDHKPRLYRASTSIFIQSSELEQALSQGATYTDDRTTADQASLLTTSVVAQKVARKFGYTGGDPRDLFRQLTVTPRSGQDFIDLTVTYPDPRGAARLANAFATSFIESRSAELRGKVVRARLAAERELAATPRTGLTSSTRESLQSRIRQLQAVESLPSGVAQQVDPAQSNPVPFTPKPARNAAFAAVLALVFAIGGAFGLNRFDRRIRTLDDVETAFKLPLLAALPRVGDPAPAVGDEVTIAPRLREVCRSLRTNIELSALDRQLQTLLVISGVSGEGKSTVIRNLAIVYAEAGSRVAVVEADVRRPTLARLFKAEPGEGLTDVVSGRLTVDEAFQAVDWSRFERENPDSVAMANGHGPIDRGVSDGEIQLLTSGREPPNPPVLLGSERMRQLLDEVREDFDIVLLDSPPLLVVSDAVPLISLADGTIVVARLGETLRDAAKRVGDVLSRIPSANPLGVVANQVSSSEVAGGYRYYSYGTRSRRRLLRRS